MATWHGVVFDIWLRGETALVLRLPSRRWSCDGLPSRSSRAERPAFAFGYGVAAFARFASEGWWACLDSNQEPDRYERPALTIELQAPPRAAVQIGRQRCSLRLQAAG